MGTISTAMVRFVSRGACLVVGWVFRGKIGTDVGTPPGI